MNAMAIYAKTSAFFTKYRNSLYAIQIEIATTKTTTIWYGWKSMPNSKASWMLRQTQNGFSETVQGWANFVDACIKSATRDSSPDRYSSAALGGGFCVAIALLSQGYLCPARSAISLCIGFRFLCLSLVLHDEKKAGHRGMGYFWAWIDPCNILRAVV